VPVSKALANRPFTTCPECRTIIRRRTEIWLWVDGEAREWLHSRCWSDRMSARNDEPVIGVGIITDLCNTDIEWEEAGPTS